MKYMIVHEGSASDLSKTVAEMIDLGWRPQGGISHAVYTWEAEAKGYIEVAHIWAQAMVKDAVSKS